MLNTKRKLIIFNPSIEDGGVEKNLYILSNYFVKYYQNIQIISSNPEKKINFNKKIKFTYPKINSGTTNQGIINTLFVYCYSLKKF